MTEITIATPEHSLSAYLRSPSGEGPWPGVVVLHDVLGQTDASRGQVDWLAASGYLAIAPDLFSWGPKSAVRVPGRAERVRGHASGTCEIQTKLLCIRAVSRAMLARSGAAFDDIEATRSA